MVDLAFVTIIIVFFALAALFVRACDHMIGADEEPIADISTADQEPEERAA